MKFFQDVADVTFTGIDHVFKASSVFCEFSVGGRDFSIKWYGVIIAFGFVLAALFGGREAYVRKMDLNKMIDVLIWGTVGGIIGARLYYCVFKWDYYGANPLDIFKIWNGGLAIYGGIIGGILAGFITCLVTKLNFLNLLDLVGMSLLIGQGVGRWGNYANQEAFGINSDGFMGMSSYKITRYILDHQAELPGVDAYKPVHPTFLYESLWCLIGFLLLYLIMRKAYKFSGQMFLCYGLWYGTGRAVFEGLRTDSLYISGTDIRVSQLLSVIAASLCAVTLVITLIRYHIKPWKTEGKDYYIQPEPMFKFQKNALHAPGERVELEPGQTMRSILKAEAEARKKPAGND